MSRHPDDPDLDRAHRLWSPTTVGVAVVLVGLLVTAGLWRTFALDTHEDVTGELDRIAQEVETQVDRRVDVAESALLTMAAQVSTGTADSREIQWVLANTAVVEELPGILAMLYAEATTTPDGLRVAPRAVHPLEPNVSVLGRNIMRDPERRRAIEAARDSGETSATSIVTHADGGVDALLVMSPVFDGQAGTFAERRAAFLGVMIAVVSPTELFADVARFPAQMTVADLGPTQDVFRSAADQARLWASAEEPSGTTRTHAFGVADHTWQLTVAPGPGFPVTSNAATIVAIAGALLSGLLGLLAAVLVGRRKHLEQLVTDRTRELRRANAELERAGRLRSQFITTVSHELRTPLTSVIGFIQTVRRMDPQDLAARDDFLARAERNGLTLHRMIEELLDFGRLERGDIVLDRRPVDVGRVVADIVRDLEGGLDQRCVVRDLPEGAVAAIDIDALERIVGNLLTNAQRYAPDGGPIEIGVRRAGEWVEVVCRDRGPGFVEHDIPMLFERFVRGSGVMGEGTGIGLSVVRDLAVAHGGDADLANRAGGGAEVTVRLPVLTVADRPAAAEVDSPIVFEQVLTEID